MALPCSKKIVHITKRNSIKASWGFYCLNCLHSFKTENKVKFHEKICKNKTFCGIVTPSEKNTILEFNQYMK